MPALGVDRSQFGRFGWWWVIAPEWNFFAAPVYPYPNLYTPLNEPFGWCYWCDTYQEVCYLLSRTVGKRDATGMSVGLVMTFGVTSVIVVGLLLLTGGARASDLAEEGKRTALEACSACHQVTESQARPAPVFDPDEYRNIAAPTFREIASKYGSKAPLLRKLITNPRHPMREQELLEADLKSIIAFIQSLAHDARQPSP